MKHFVIAAAGNTSMYSITSRVPIISNPVIKVKYDRVL